MGFRNFPIRSRVGPRGKFLGRNRRNDERHKIRIGGVHGSLPLINCPGQDCPTITPQPARGVIGEFPRIRQSGLLPPQAGQPVKNSASGAVAVIP